MTAQTFPTPCWHAARRTAGPDATREEVEEVFYTDRAWQPRPHRRPAAPGADRCMDFDVVTGTELWWLYAGPHAQLVSVEGEGMVRLSWEGKRLSFAEAIACVEADPFLRPEVTARTVEFLTDLARWYARAVPSALAAVGQRAA